MAKKHAGRSTRISRDAPYGTLAGQAEHDQRILAEALPDTAAALSSMLNLDDVLGRILENAGRVVAHDASSIMLLEGDTVRIVRIRGYAEHGTPSDLEVMRFRADEIMNLAHMLRTARPIAIPDTSTDPMWAKIPERGGSPELSSQAYAAIRTCLGPAPGVCAARYSFRASDWTGYWKWNRNRKRSSPLAEPNRLHDPNARQWRSQRSPAC